MTSIRRTRWTLAGAALVLLTASACSSSSPTSTSTSTTTSSSGSTTAAPGTGGSTAGSASGGSAVIPVTVGDVGGSPAATVQVSVGGGPPVTVILDTGSSGLVITQSSVGSGVTMSGQSDQSDFSSGTLTTTVASAPITIGSITTPAIDIGIITNFQCASGSTDCTSGPEGATGQFGGTQGLLGIGLSDNSTTGTVFSPLLQLEAPYTQGYTLDLTPAGLAGQGTLTVGPVEVAGNSTVAPFIPGNPPTYPNGTPGYLKDANMCWTMRIYQGCGLTDFDSGESNTTFSPNAMQGLPTQAGQEESGVQVTMALTAGATPIWSFTTGNQTSVNAVNILPALPGPTLFNTGLAFFGQHKLGYDLVNEQFVITPVT